MIRTQVQLTSEQAKAVKSVARERGVSMAEVLRVLVDEHLVAAPGDDRRQRAIRAVGRHHSGRRDISREHDRELGEAYSR
ncbi:MAG: ribbon-helix-helix protein, CopG family [Acidimicrobiales bacterium]